MTREATSTISARSNLPPPRAPILLLRPAERNGTLGIFRPADSVVVARRWRRRSSRPVRHNRISRRSSTIKSQRDSDTHRLRRRHRRLSLTTDELPACSLAPSPSLSPAPRWREPFQFRNIGRPQDFRTSSRALERERGGPFARKPRVPISRECAILILHLTIDINYYERRMRAQRRVSRGTCRRRLISERHGRMGRRG